MKRIFSLILVVVMVFAMSTTVFAAEPVTPLDPNLVMYADDFTVGAIVPANFDPYNPASQIDRLNPSNALGPFDAIAPANVSDYFFAANARTWSHYTFADKFMNVEGVPDIEFAEVTWSAGGTWHTEAMKVYLTGAYIKNADGEIVPYGTTDDGIGYYAGVAWNRIGLEFVDEATRLSVTESYFSGTRDFANNDFYRSGLYGTYTQFHLPGEVVYAEGIHLVDITSVVHDLAYPATFTNVSGTGALVTLNSLAWDVINYNQITVADVIALSGLNGNTDGYDLDAIRVYKYIPWRSDDTATGSGTKILEKGTWFMYNCYDGSVGTFDLQAGNPKDGPTIIGSYTVTNNNDGTFTVDYDIDDKITKNGYVYDIEVMDEHLSISNTLNFTASPGTDDNQDFGTAFADADGFFYIFAHFSVEYK